MCFIDAGHEKRNVPPGQKMQLQQFSELGTKTAIGGFF